MASFKDVSEDSWTEMELGGSIFTFALFDMMRNGPIDLESIPDIYRKTLDKMVKVGFAVIDDGVVTATETGFKFERTCG